MFHSRSCLEARRCRQLKRLGSYSRPPSPVSPETEAFLTCTAGQTNRDTECSSCHAANAVTLFVERGGRGGGRGQAGRDRERGKVRGERERQRKRGRGREREMGERDGGGGGGETETNGHGEKRGGGGEREGRGVGEGEWERGVLHRYHNDAGLMESTDHG